MNYRIEWLVAVETRAHRERPVETFSDVADGHFIGE
jgi:hypothetical protein